MDFARKQMEKHGWKDGGGLGKNEHGIKEPIKAKLKHDSRGVGHDVGEEFTFHWWDHVFNKAASTIQVDHTEEGVQVKNTGSTERHKTRKSKTYADKSMLYGQFVKGATLKGEVEVEESEKPIVIATDTLIKPPVLMPHNEDEIFRLCGGRTAHKGARHGLKANGKLQRIQQQEEEELRRLMAGSANENPGSKHKLTNEKAGKSTIENSVDLTNNNEGKKKKLKQKILENGVVNDLGNGELGENCSVDKTKKKKKKERHSKDIEEETEENVKKRKTCDDNDEHSHMEDMTEIVSKRKKKKSKKKARESTSNVLENEVCDQETGCAVDNDDTDVTQVKKKKKKSKKHQD